MPVLATGNAADAINAALPLGALSILSAAGAFQALAVADLTEGAISVL
jgi:hypothetical protein